MCPGTDQYVIGSPVFKKTTITLENGNQFVIEAKDNSEKNVFIQSATLNGKNFTKNFITYSDLIQGGNLSIQMSENPNKQRGIKTSDRPFSVSEQE